MLAARTFEATELTLGAWDLTLTFAGLMKGRRPGVSAVLFDEYAGGVKASSRASKHAGVRMLLLSHAALAMSAAATALAAAPRVLTLSALFLSN
jgi:hypothetical protein